MQGNHPKFLTKAELRTARALASPCRRRSYRFGQVIKEAIESWPSEKRVAVFASGGMSHFVIDEEFDRKFVGALKAGTRTTSRRFRSRTFSPARRS